MNKEETKRFILDKFTEKWVKENKEMLADYQELCYDLLMFRVKWGIEIGFIFKNPEEVKGRELGKGMVEELFDAQKFTNKSVKKDKRFRNLTNYK